MLCVKSTHNYRLLLILITKKYIYFFINRGETNRQMSDIVTKIEEYKQKLQKMEQRQEEQLEQMKQEYIQIFKKQLQNSAQKHMKRYRNNKKSLKQQIQAVLYYWKMSQHTGQQYPHSQQQQAGNQQQKLQLQQSIKGWTETLKTVNLYSLFKSIDEKLSFNQAMLKQFKFVCIFPQKGENHYQNILFRSSILLEQIRQYSLLISTLMTKLNRSCKQEHMAYVAIQQKYTNLLRNTHEQEKLEIKIKDSLNYAVSSIMSHKFLKSIELMLVNNDGLISKDQYQRLGESLLNHRFYVKTLSIKIMDMQFQQEKCDILKRYLKKLKVLQKLHIYNYYSECKLGLFVDFNWHPYRKSINIKSGTWK